MRYLIFSLPFLLFLSACGGGNKEEQSEQTKTQKQNVRTVEIIGIDQMKYVVKEEEKQLGTGDSVKTSRGDSYLLLENIKAKAGEKLRIRLTNQSKLPATAMSHNWILLKPSVDPEDFADVAIQAKANDYIPEYRAYDVIAHTGLASGGKTVEVTFTVPEKTGEYDYLCSFPGHFTAGMKGKLIAQ